VEVDVADPVRQQLVGMPVDDRDAIEAAEDRLHVVRVLGPEVPVAIVLVERRV